MILLMILLMSLADFALKTERPENGFFLRLKLGSCVRAREHRTPCNHTAKLRRAGWILGCSRRSTGRCTSRWQKSFFDVEISSKNDHSTSQSPCSSSSLVLEMEKKTIFSLLWLSSSRHIIVSSKQRGMSFSHDFSKTKKENKSCKKRQRIL